MVALTSVLGMMLLAMFIGKTMRRVTAGTYTIVAILALIQVVIVAIYMYSVEAPRLAF